MITGAENTSFIPKKSIDDTKPEKTGSIDFVFLVTLVIFLMVLFSAIGLFLYKSFLNSSIEESTIMLERERDNFDTESIKQFSRLGERLEVAEALLNNHLDLTGVFEMLSTNTLKSIQFTDFSFSADDNGEITITMSGESNSYSSVALQSDMFGRVVEIQNPVFSNLDVNNKGKVVFDFSANLDKDLVSYKKRLGQQ